MDFDTQRSTLVDDLKQNPDDKQALKALGDLCAAEQRWTDLAESLMELARHFGDQEHAARFGFLAARVWAKQAGDPVSAAQAYRLVLSVDQDNLDAVDGLKEALAEAEDWAGIVEVLEREAELRDDPEDLADIYYEMGAVWDLKLDDPEKAKAAYQKAFKAHPGCTKALEAARGIYEREENWGLVARLIQLQIRVTEGREELVGLYRELGTVLAERLDDLEGAKEALEAALDLSPDDEEVFAALEKIEQAMAEDRAETMQDGAQPDAPEQASEAPEQAAEVPEQTGEVPEQAAEAPEQAAEEPVEGVWEPIPIGPQPDGTVASPQAEGGVPFEEYLSMLEAAAEDEGPESPAAMDLEEARLAQAKNWRELQARLRRRFGNDPDGKVAQARRLAVLAEWAGASNKAVDAWRRVLQAVPRDPQALDALKRLYRATGKWNAVVDLLKKDVEALPDDAVAEKVAIYLQMVEIYREELHLDVMVNTTYQNILKVDPGNRAAVDALVEQYEKMRRWPDLVGVLQKKAEMVEDPEEKIGLYKRLAGIFVDRFSNQSEAIKAYEKVLELRPDDREAMDYLEKMYERRRDWEKLVAIMEREVELLEDPDDKADALTEVARLATEKLKRSPKPTQLWERVLEMRSEEAAALAALEKIHEHSKDWAALARILELEASLEPDEAGQVALYEKLGKIYGERLKDRDKAIATWQRVLTLDPDHSRAREALKRAYVEARDWDALTAHYAQRGAWKDLVRILESQVGVVKEPEVKVELLFRAAAVHQDHLDQPDRAVKALERILTVDEENLQAATRLIPVYEAKKDYKRLVKAYEIRLGHTDDKDERRRILTTLAGLCEEKLRDPGAAFRWLLTAARENPADEDLRAELERLSGELGNWEELVALYREIHKALEGVDRARLDLRLGRALADELGNTAEATEAFGRVLEIDPENRESLYAMEAIYKRTGQWDELLENLGRSFELADDPSERRRLLLEMALVQEEQLGNPDAAIDTYYRLLEESPEDLDALQNLHRLLKDRDRPEEVARILETEIMVLQAGGGASDSELTGLLLELGRILHHQLGRTEEAIERFREVLAIVPDHDDAISELEGLLGTPEHLPKVFDILDPAYEGASRWDRLVALLERRIPTLDDRTDRLEMLLRAGELYDTRLADSQGAFGAYGRALKEEPRDERAREKTEELAERTEAWGELVDLYREVLTQDLPMELAASFYLTLAETEDTKLGDQAAAEDAYRAVLELDPENRRALDALERLYTNGQKWEELIGVYQRKLDLADDPETRKELGFKIGFVWEEMLNNLVEATETYRSILDQDEHDERAIEALDRLYTAREMWPELAENLRLQLAMSEGERNVDLTNRLAALLDEKLGETREAVALYRSVLERRPGDPTAMAALERLMDDVEHRLTIAQVLEPHYEAQQQWNELVGVLEIQLDDDPYVRLGLLHRIAQIQEHMLDSPEAAFATYGRALADVPSDEPTRKELHRLAEDLGAWRELVELYQERVQELADPELAATFLATCARIHEERLEDLDGAIDAWRRVLDMDPENLEVLDALIRLHQVKESWAELVETLLRKADVVLDAEPRIELLTQAAMVYEEMLGDRARAVEVYNRILELDPEHQGALDALDRLYEQEGAWDDLLGILERKAALAQGAEDRKALLARSARILEREQGDAQGAIDALRAMLELDPVDDSTLSELDRLLGQTGDWMAQMEILDRRAELAAGAAERIELELRMARLWDEKLDDPQRAIEGYRGILGEQPDHQGARESLWAMVRGDREERAASEVLLPLFRALGDWAEAVELLEVRLTHVQDPDERISLLMEAARIREEELEDGQAAFDTLARAFREDPERVATVELLEALAGRTGAWERYVSLLEDEVDGLVPDLAAGLLMRVARVLEEELGEPAKAIERYRRVLELRADDERAIESLDRIYQQQGMWPELSELLETKILMAASDDDRVALMMRRAAILEEMLDSVGEAVAVYREVLATQPGHPAAVQNLERIFGQGTMPLEISEVLSGIYEDDEQWAKLLELKSRLLEHLPDDESRISTLKDGAMVALEKVGDPELAIQWYGRAYVLDPRDEWLGEELERLARLTAAWTSLVEVYLQAYERIDEVSLKWQVLLKLAKIFEDELGDRERAEQAYEGVLQLDENQRTALAALDRIYQSQGRWADLAGLLEREIRLEDDPDEEVALTFRLAQLYEHQLGDLDLAVERYRKILDIEPFHEGSLAALEAIYVQREEWEPLFEIYQRQAEIAPDEQSKAGIYAKMANLASEMLERPSEAVSMWHMVLDLLGEDLDALRSLAQIHERAGQWAELVDVLDRQVRVVDDREEEISLLAKLGRIHSRELDDDSRARAAWEQVVDLDPDHREALLALADIYRKSEAWDDLVETLERLLALGQEDQQTQVAFLGELGRLQGDTLMRPGEAIEAWRKVLALVPDDMEAINALERLYEEQGDWASCLEILELKADQVPEPEAKVEILLRAASMAVDKTMERERAVGILERVLELDPANDVASATLERIFEEDGDHKRLLDVLLKRLEHAGDPDSRAGLLLRAADICENRLYDPVNAFFCVSRAFVEKPADEAIGSELERLAKGANQWDPLLNLYEGLVEQVDQAEQIELHRKIGRIYAEELEAWDEAIAAYQQVLKFDRTDEDALAALERLFRKAGRWAELVAVLQLRLEGETDPDLKAGYYLQMGEILEHGQVDRAVAAYRAALREREGDETALAALERIFTREGRWKDLIDVLSRRAEAALDAEEIIGFTRRIGEIWETSLQVPDRAMEAYRRILELDPTDVAACQALERLYTARDKWQDLLELYRIWLDAVDDPAQRIELLTKMAAIHEEEFGDAMGAIRAYEAILGLDPENMTAIRNLERLNREQGRWVELVEVYRRHLDAAHGDRVVSLEILEAIGEVYAKELEQPADAIDTYRRIVELDPGHTQALEALATLYERDGDWEATVEALEKLRAATATPEERVELAHRIGVILRDEMSDRDKAKEYFYLALDEDPRYLPSIEALRDMAYEDEDWRTAIQFLKRQEEASLELADKAKALLEIGKIYRDKEDDPLTASTYFERCVELDPENVEAAEPLVEMYLHEQRWERAEPLLDMLVKKLGMSRYREGIHLVHYKAGLVAEQLLKDDKALRHYRNAWELDATHLPTLEGLGRLLYKREDWDRAFRVYQTILVHHRDQQSEGQIVEIFYRLGTIKLKMGERSRGRALFEKALEVDPHHGPTLKALIDLHRQQGDWEKVVHYKEVILETLEDDLERFDLMVDIANIWREKLRNIPKAIEAYNRALTVDPKSRQVMHHLLNLYTQEKAWAYAVQILERTIALEDRPEKVARYCYTAGVIYRDQLKDAAKAVELFNRALDADPGLLKAFEAIDRIQTASKDWAKLERNYRKMIKRVTERGVGGEKLQVFLWKNLGEIYRTRMKDFDKAATAFGMAAKLEPRDMLLQEIVAELYEHMPDAKAKAIAVHRRMLAVEPFRYSSYKALNRLYMETGQYDKAWCMCAALSVLGQASPEEEEFYQKYRNPTIKYPNQVIGQELWVKHLYHPKEDLYLGNIFAILAAYSPFVTQTLKDWGLKKKHLHDLRKPLLFNNVANAALMALGLQNAAPQFYVKRDQFTGITNGDTRPWSVIVGPDMLQGRLDRHLAFILGKTLTMYRAEHYLAGVRTTQQLKVLFFAAWKLTHPDANVPPPSDPQAFADIIKALHRSIPAPIQVDLQNRISERLRMKEPINLNDWVDGIEATSNRVGLLLSGDLETATQIIKTDQVFRLGKASTKKRLEDLLLFATSESYFELRKALGLTIG